MGILLTDEEIEKAWRDKAGITIQGAERNVAKAQLKKMVRDMNKRAVGMKDAVVVVYSEDEWEDLLNEVE